MKLIRHSIYACFSCLFAFSVNAAPSANVVILMDASGSVGDEAFEDEKRYVAELASSYQLEQAQVGVIRYSTGAQVIHSLGDNQDRDALASKIAETEFVKGRTHTRTAVELAMDEFDMYSLDPNHKRILVLLTDGNPYPLETQGVCDLAGALNARSISTVAILVGPSINQGNLSCITEEGGLVLSNDFSQIGHDMSDGGHATFKPALLHDFDLDSLHNNDELLTDSDFDGLPDYIDSDDDGDGVLTLAEDSNADGNVLNDDSDRDGIADYLDSEVTPFAVDAVAGPDQYVLDRVTLSGYNSTVEAGFENAEFTWTIEQKCMSDMLCEPAFDVNGVVVDIELASQGEYIATLFIEDVNGVSHSDSLRIAAYGHAYTQEQVDAMIAAAIADYKANDPRLQRKKHKIERLKKRLHKKKTRQQVLESWVETLKSRIVALKQRLDIEKERRLILLERQAQN
ncbi:vWA domain-containing protein [Agaribacterium sp. ZY112]|uniref:vWA domain-containing protein n=1 Tax=Agaribacterium sp. ZY112 TaxID=3233574 RepID=UPI0035233DB7